MEVVKAGPKLQKKFVMLKAASYLNQKQELQLYLSESGFASIFGSDAQDHEILALLEVREPENCTGSSRLLVCCTKLNQTEIVKTVLNKPVPNVCPIHAQKGIYAYTTDRFLQQFELVDGQLLQIKPFEYPVIMSKVVLAAETDAAYYWAKSDMFSVAFVAVVCQNKVFARENCTLQLPYSKLISNDPKTHFDYCKQIKTVACEPVRQGIIGLKTEIIISRQTHLNDLVSIKSSSSSESEGDMTGKALSGLTNKTVILSQFANKYISQRQCDGFTSVSSSEKSNANLKSIEKVLNVKTLSNQAIKAMLEHRNKIDLHTVVIVSKQTAKQLGLFDQARFNIMLIKDLEKLNTGNPPVPQDITETRSNVDGCQPTERKAKLVTVRIAKSPMKILEDGVAYLTRTLLFNLESNPPLAVNEMSLRLLLQQAKKTQQTVTSQTGGHTLIFASELHLVLIHSPQYQDNIKCDAILQNFFQTPRLVTLDDVLCLPMSTDLEMKSPMDGQLLEKDLHYGPFVYFKVKKIVPEILGFHSLLADTDHTSVFQDGCIHSYIPSSCSDLEDDINQVPVLNKPIKELENLIYPQLKNSSFEDHTITALISGPTGCGKLSVLQAVANNLGLHIFTENCYNLNGETSSATETKIKALIHASSRVSPCLLVLRNIDALGRDRDGIGHDPRVAKSFKEIITSVSDKVWPVVIVATTSSAMKNINPDILSVFLHPVVMEVPSETERLDIISYLLNSVSCAHDINCKYLAQRTAGMSFGDLRAMVNHAGKVAYNRICDYIKEEGSLSLEKEKAVRLAGFNVWQKDFNKALDAHQGAHSEAIGAPKIPNVTWADVGGLAAVKAEILDTIQLPLQHPELFASGLRRSGILLYGPPGCGKTLLAKAVATECSLNFLSIKGPELINKYVGQSEENVREVFVRARSATPCVIFFDELDSLVPNRGRSGDSGGVMDRVVSQLLAELDGLQKNCDLFVIGATNRPDLVDPALLRPGRFDKLVYLGVSEDHTSQINILKALTRKFKLETGNLLERVSEKCPFNLTGADFYALCSDAWMNAVKKKIHLLDQGIEVDETNTVISEADFDEALEGLVPSVTQNELIRYKSMQTWYQQLK